MSPLREMPTRSIVARLSWGGLPANRQRPQLSLTRCMSSICPRTLLRMPAGISWPGPRTATDTVRRNTLTCANMQERVAEAVDHADQDLDDTLPHAYQYPGN